MRMHVYEKEEGGRRGVEVLNVRGRRMVVCVSVIRIEEDIIKMSTTPMTAFHEWLCK